MSIQEKIREIEKEMARTQINKATNRHLGVLRARIARLKDQERERILRSKEKTGEGFTVRMDLDLQATADNMVAGFQWLIDNAEPGDEVCFSYSGHGGRSTEGSALISSDLYGSISLLHFWWTIPITPWLHLLRISRRRNRSATPIS